MENKAEGGDEWSVAYVPSTEMTCLQSGHLWQFVVRVHNFVGHLHESRPALILSCLLKH